MNLQHYLRRISFDGEPDTSYRTLTTIPRCQVLATTFENLDVQLERPLTPNIAAAYSKIVEQGRGGWCYELNGLLGWALESIGFDVMRVAATVGRSGPRHGEDWGDHLCLIVTFEQERFLVDAGFGGSLLSPLPLRPHRRHDPPYTVELENHGIDGWRFKEAAHGSSAHFDFLVEPADEAQLEKTCARLQSDPDSPFVKTLVAMKRYPDRHEILRGRVRSTLTGNQKDKAALRTRDTWMDSLAKDFHLDVPEIVDVWPSIIAREGALL
ncbi:MAG: arylamine N-acetyltransferase [Myxococcota bacterium]